MASKSVEEFFRKLGVIVEQRWKAQNFDNAVFADVAFRALEEMPPIESIRYPEIADWVMTTERLPLQSPILVR